MTNNTYISSITPKRFDEAILLELGGALDFEGRSPVDFLINEIQQHPENRPSYIEAAVEVVANKNNQEEGWWVVFERIISLGEIISFGLASVLEAEIQSNEIKNGDDRASVYTILDICGKPQPAYIIEKDQILFEEAPLRWLDLMLLRIPVLEDGQSLVLRAIRAGHFGVHEFRYRLEEMRALGGTKLGDWIRAVRSELPPQETAAYDQLVNAAFGLKETDALETDRQIEDKDVQAALGSILAGLDRILRAGDPSWRQSALRRPQGKASRASFESRLRNADVEPDPDPRAALNIDRIQHTKQLANMSV